MENPIKGAVAFHELLWKNIPALISSSSISKLFRGGKKTTTTKQNTTKKPEASAETHLFWILFPMSGVPSSKQRAQEFKKKAYLRPVDKAIRLSSLSQTPISNILGQNQALSTTSQLSHRRKGQVTRLLAGYPGWAVWKQICSGEVRKCVQRRAVRVSPYCHTTRNGHRGAPRHDLVYPTQHGSRN